MDLSTNSTSYSHRAQASSSWPSTSNGAQRVTTGSNQVAESDAVLNYAKDSAVSERENSVHALVWKDGIGTLPGCDDLKFRMNEAGDVEIITDDLPSVSNPTTERGNSTGGIDGIKNEFNETQNEENGGFDASKSIASGENLQIVDIRSDFTTAAVKDDSVAKCEFCGVIGMASGFRGRFCGRKCVARNATQYRNSSQRLKRELSRNASLAPVNDCVPNGDGDKSKDLKIRIRFSPPVDGSEGAIKRRQSSSSHEFIPIAEKKKGKFSWSEYGKDAVLAPAFPFEILSGKNPFSGANEFKLGMALEGVDPVHQSLICPLSVTAVKGFRVRLHFCGYCESYDFWTNADSPLIFPCGFCEKTGRKLEPPKGYQSDNFLWEKYMKKLRHYAAPEVIFSVIREEKDCSFKPEEKLEAVDKHNPDLICVATIGDVIGQNILIHFDGWTHDFDYWCTSSSRLIHPVGWCKKEGKTLTPPEGYPQNDFSWGAYLSECGARAASEESFSPSVSHGLKTGMKLEVVDPRNAILIRVATIVAINDYRLQIHFDGWGDIYDFWTDLESPDIHPPGWCERANYPLQPPMNELTSVTGQNGCPVPGCIGVGHIRGSKFVGHHSEFGCPYSQQNLHKQLLHDRLSRSRSSTSVQESGGYRSGSDGENYQARPAKVRKTRKSYQNEAKGDSANVGVSNSKKPAQQPERKTVISSSELDILIDEKGKNHYSPENHSVFMSALSSFPNYDLPVCWDQHCKILPSVKGMSVSDVSKWSVADVASFVGTLTGRPEIGKAFVTEEIDGEAILLLTQTDIVKVLNVKLGPAVKIYNALLLVKAAENLPV